MATQYLAIHTNVIKFEKQYVNVQQTKLFSILFILFDYLLFLFFRKSSLINHYIDLITI